MVQLEENQAVKCLQKGTYRFLAIAMDEAGNASIAEYDVEAIQ